MNPPVSRTDAEAKIYLGLQRCPRCGQAETSWEYAGRFYEDSPTGDVILDKYRGTCESSRHTRFVEFTALQPDEPADTAFGGATPSQLLDAGQWVGVASFLEKLSADSEMPELKHVEWARDAYLEAMKFIPPGADAISADSLHSDQGRETAAGKPHCLTRAWLQDHVDETAAWARRLPPGKGRPPASWPVTAPPKPARTHVEAQLYLTTSATCRYCDRAALAVRDPDQEAPSRYETRSIAVRCTNCGEQDTHAFHIPPQQDSDGMYGPGRSRLIDPAGWLAQAAAAHGAMPADIDRVSAGRRTEYRNLLETSVAAIEEAMKFLDPDAATIGPSSFFSQQGRELFAADPARFRRDRLEAQLEGYRSRLRRFQGAAELAPGDEPGRESATGDDEQHREPSVPEVVSHDPPRPLVSPPVPRAGPDRSWLEELRGKLIAELLDVAAEVYPGAKPALERDTGVAAGGSERFIVMVTVSARPASAAERDAAGALRRAAALLKARDWMCEWPSDTELRVRQRWLRAIAWVTADRGTGNLRLSAEAGYLTRFTVLPSRARTLAEAKFYLEYHLECRACGNIALQQRGISTGEVGNHLEHDLITRCGRCGDDDEHAFWLPLEQKRRPGPGLGGQERSRLLDPGDWLLVARRVHAVVPYEYKRRRDASSRDFYRDRLQIAVTAVGEAMKFLDPGAATIDPRALFSPKGRELFTANPAIFRRDRLAEQQAAYEEQLKQYSGWGHRR